MLLGAWEHQSSVKFNVIKYAPTHIHIYIICTYIHVHVNERCRRKEERSKQGQTNTKAKQHSTPKAVTFPKQNELPQVGLEPTTLYILDRVLYQLIYLGTSAVHKQTHTH